VGEGGSEGRGHCVNAIRGNSGSRPASLRATKNKKRDVKEKQITFGRHKWAPRHVVDRVNCYKCPRYAIRQSPPPQPSPPTPFIHHIQVHMYVFVAAIVVVACNEIYACLWPANAKTVTVTL